MLFLLWWPNVIVFVCACVLSWDRGMKKYPLSEPILLNVFDRLANCLHIRTHTYTYYEHFTNHSFSIYHQLVFYRIFFRYLFNQRLTLIQFGVFKLTKFSKEEKRYFRSMCFDDRAFNVNKRSVFCYSHSLPSYFL